MLQVKGGDEEEGFHGNEIVRYGLELQKQENCSRQ